MSIDTSIMAELCEAVDRIQKGIRDPQAMRKAAARMDREREELRKRIGTVNVAVDLIREARDE